MSYTDLKIEELSGIGKKRAETLNKLGIYTVCDLLEYYPRHYEDWSKSYSVSEAPLNENCCVKGIISTAVSEYRVRKGMTLYKFTVTDGVINMFVTLFNQKYVAKSLKRGEEYLFFGKPTGSFLRKEMSSPDIAPVESEKIRPIYHATEGLNSKFIEKCTEQAISMINEKSVDPIPSEIRKEYNLCQKSYALKNIHFPENSEAIEISRKRLVFEELLILQLGLLRLRKRNFEGKSPAIEKDFTNNLLCKLPFELTNAQKRAVSEAISDMKKTTPMNRLLQGDVGSGKTAVAVTLLYNAVCNGFQSALMAPTEILAFQHYAGISKMLKGTNIKIALLTGSSAAAEKRRILQLLKDGDIDIIIGTHAIIQSTVEFKKLGLVITDEQHRFGVNQRTALSDKGDNPHTLVMSATPIPRTLALIIYGDLDISILDEMPKGRQTTETYAVRPNIRKRAYNYIKQHLDRGLQGYIVCPLVDEGETDLASAVKFYEKLKNGFFKDYKVGLLNGKMKPSEKDSVMRAFSMGEIQLLVATTVIEVGIDVPNANIMVIENAERFGLSQLHQLRGRIGRGKDKATCILISEAENDEAVKRLSIMCKTSDGFKIADEDLKLRGPGDFFGSRQHGLPLLKIASIFSDRETLKITSSVARNITNKDKTLSLPENSGLKQAVDELFKNKYSNN